MDFDNWYDAQWRGKAWLYAIDYQEVRNQKK